VSALPVTYVVNTERRAETKFPGQLCARWKIQKHVSIVFFRIYSGRDRKNRLRYFPHRVSNYVRKPPVQRSTNETSGE
jgi:hypothetical protein